MTNDTIEIAEFRKNATETFRVTVRTIKGQRVVDLRVWETDPDGQMRPTSRGLATGVWHAGKLAEALAEAERLANVD